MQAQQYYTNFADIKLDIIILFYSVRNFMEGRWLWRAWAFKRHMECGDNQLQTFKVEYDSYNKSIGVEFGSENEMEKDE